MDAGLEPNVVAQGHASGLEKAVFQAERKARVRSPWYRARGLWAAGGALIGFAAGCLWQQILIPEKVSAREPMPQAVQSVISESVAEEGFKVRPAKPAATAVDSIKRQVEAAPMSSIATDTLVGDLPALPATMPVPELRGTLRNVEPLPLAQPYTIQPAPSDSNEVRKTSSGPPEWEAKAKIIGERIEALRAQREELLKSFYEDAIPVKHVDEDIAKAEEELKALRTGK